MDTPDSFDQSIGSRSSREDKQSDSPKASERKITANRENSKLSTGATTLRGKKRSSLGAVKHGILCRSVVLPNGEESEEEFAGLLKQFCFAYQVRDAVEHALVQDIVSILWRKARLLRTETAEIANQTEAWARQNLMQPLGALRRESALANAAPYSANPQKCNPLDANVTNQESLVRQSKDDENLCDPFPQLAMLRSKLAAIREELLRNGKLSSANQRLLWDWFGIRVDINSANYSVDSVLSPLEAANLANRLAGNIHSLQILSETLTRAADRQFHMLIAKLSLPTESAVDKLMRYEAHLNRQLYSAMRMLQEHRAWQSQMQIATGIPESKATRRRSSSKRTDANDAPQYPEGIQAQKKQELPNEPKKSFEMNAPSNVVAFKKENRGEGE